MKNSLILAVALVVALLAGCGSDSDEGATTSVSPSVAAGSSDPAPSSDATTAGSSTAGSATAAAMQLDEQSTAWFANFCTGFVGLRDSFSSVQTDLANAGGTTVTEKQAAAAGVISGLGEKLKSLATSAGALPPPTIENGEQMVTTAVDGFNTLGDAIIGAADEFARAPVTDQASFEAAATQLQTSLQEVFADTQSSFAAIDTMEQPGLDQAVAAIPQCAEMAA
ncbi:hypothetical protein [Nakamurella deserti]|uniref:hypothetical protein n=1 Tax=Nakamurella deserti TaxID=2164074 RepID=UPI000DBE1DD9|nr:hypothetical protein [Nakamurella deserti]